MDSYVKMGLCLVMVLGLVGCASTRSSVKHIVQCEDTCCHVHGIDVSHYQGRINWRKLCRHAHLRYVYVKATEGANFQDDRYPYNLKKARKHGLLVGSYLFFRPNVPLLRQMDNFFRYVPYRKQHLVPMVDVETTGQLQVGAFRDSLRIFLDMMEATYRCKPLIYTGQNFYNKYLINCLPAGCPLMVANYSRRPLLLDGHDVLIWQYTSRGSVSGTEIVCDKSRLLEGEVLDSIKK
jgi:lysozyme